MAHNLVFCKDWKAHQKPGQSWKPRSKDIKILAFDQAGHFISVDGKRSLKLYKGKLEKHIKTGIEIHDASIDPKHAIILAWNHDQLMIIRYLEDSTKSISFDYLSYALVINNGQSIFIDGDEVGLQVVGLETGQTQKTLKPPLQFPDDFDVDLIRISKYSNFTDVQNVGKKVDFKPLTHLTGSG